MFVYLRTDRPPSATTQSTPPSLSSPAKLASRLSASSDSFLKNGFFPPCIDACLPLFPLLKVFPFVGERGEQGKESAAAAAVAATPMPPCFA